jgi:hypothetical protein
MNLGSMGVTWKQKPSHHNGRLRGQKRHAKFRARWKWCWQFSSTTKASFTMSTHQKVKLLTRSTTSKFSIGCVMQCGASDLCPGSEVTGSSTMTTPQSTCPTLSRTSWWNIGSHKGHAPPFTRHGHVWLFSIPRGENVVEKEEVSRHGRDKRNVMTELWAVPWSQFQKCFGQWKDCWKVCVMSEGDYFEGY